MMNQKIQDLINPIPVLVEEYNESVEVPTNQYTSTLEEYGLILKKNKSKLLLGGGTLLVLYSFMEE